MSSFILLDILQYLAKWCHPIVVARLCTTCKAYSDLWRYVEEIDLAHADWYIFDESGAQPFLQTFTNLVNNDKLPNLVSLTQSNGLPVDQHMYQQFASSALLPQLRFFDATHACWMFKMCSTSWKNLNPHKLEAFRFAEDQLFSWPPELLRVLDGGFSNLTTLELRLSGEATQEIFRNLARAKLPQLKFLRVGELDSAGQAVAAFGENNQFLKQAVKNFNTTLKELHFNFSTRFANFSWCAILFGSVPESTMNLGDICYGTYGVPISIFKFYDLSVWFDCVYPSRPSSEKVDTFDGIHQLCWKQRLENLSGNMLLLYARELLLTIDKSEGWRPRASVRRICETELDWYVKTIRGIIIHWDFFGLYDHVISYEAPNLHNPVSVLCASVANAAFELKATQHYDFLFGLVKTCIEIDAGNVPYFFGPAVPHVGRRLLEEPSGWRLKHLNMSQLVHPRCHKSCRFGYRLPHDVKPQCRSMPLFQWMLESIDFDDTDDKTIFERIFFDSELFPSKIILKLRGGHDLPPLFKSSRPYLNRLANIIEDWSFSMEHGLLDFFLWWGSPVNMAWLRQFAQLASASTMSHAHAEEQLLNLLWKNLIQNDNLYRCAKEEAEKVVLTILADFPTIPHFVLRCLRHTEDQICSPHSVSRLKGILAKHRPEILKAPSESRSSCVVN